MSNKAASLTGALLSGKDSGARAPTPSPMRGPQGQGPAGPAAAAEGGDALRQFSLPLDPARHRRLRLAAAHLDQTEEALMLAALDHYLDSVVSALLDGRCACLEEGRATGQGCVAATFASAKSERPQ
ncbi:MAG TPA: hypothetical protein VF930_00430 [Stellaceae bacterium]